MSDFRRALLFAVVILAGYSRRVQPSPLVIIMARRLIEAGPAAVAIIGQAHNLTDAIKAACAGCRVDVRRVEAMGRE
jgi:hypothetical protein